MIAISGSKNWMKQIRSFSCLCIVSLSVACSSPSTQINEPPMEKKYLHQLVDYNHWATEQIVTWLLTLDEAIMHQVTPSSFPTLHETVVHNWGAEGGWTNNHHGTRIRSRKSPTHRLYLLPEEIR